MAELKGSKTHTNLKEAFAGESCRRTAATPTTSAKVAGLEGHPDLAGLFRDTAEGETGHAHGHLDYLKRVGDPATGEPIGDSVKNLKASIAGETYEYTTMYPGFAKTRARRGLPPRSPSGSRRSARAEPFATPAGSRRASTTSTSSEVVACAIGTTATAAPIALDDLERAPFRFSRVRLDSRRRPMRCSPRLGDIVAVVSDDAALRVADTGATSGVGAERLKSTSRCSVAFRERMLAWDGTRVRVHDARDDVAADRADGRGLARVGDGRRRAVSTGASRPP